VTIQRPGSTKSAAVAGIEMFRKLATEAQAGDNVGVLLRDVAKQDVKRGDILLGSATDFTWAP
jgi:elongation factor Tu